jgi:ribonuclease T2
MSISMRQSGTPKFFNTGKAFGFIAPAVGSSDIFMRVFGRRGTRAGDAERWREGVVRDRAGQGRHRAEGSSSSDRSLSPAGTRRRSPGARAAFLARAPLVAALLFCLGLTAAIAQERRGAAGRFDYYLLSLSWAPSFCAGEGARKRTAQCGPTGSQGFVLHGLWPQYERGWPAYCPTSHPLRLPASLLKAHRDLSPDRGLLAHQWRKHGVCTGLSPERYFEAARDALHRFAIPQRLAELRQPASFSPDALRALFLDANPELSPDMLVFTCDGRRLDEVRLCLDRQGAPRRCAADVRARQCRSTPQILLPARPLN